MYHWTLGTVSLSRSSFNFIVAMATQTPVANEKNRAMSTTSIDNEKGQEIGQSAEWIDTVAERAYGMSVSQPLPNFLNPWASSLAKHPKSSI